MEEKEEEEKKRRWRLRDEDSKTIMGRRKRKWEDRWSYQEGQEGWKIGKGQSR